jgi:hypothetical protein
MHAGVVGANVTKYCGMTDEFCLTEKSPTCNPGAGGCISNCDRKIKNNATPPKEFISIGYLWVPTYYKSTPIVIPKLIFR